MSKRYDKLEEAALRAYALLYMIHSGNHKALENAESCARQLKDALRMCDNEDVERIAHEVGDEQ